MRALIFDLDGTLIDTVYAHVFAWQRALAESGLAIDGWKIHRRIGMSGGLFTRAVAREIGKPLSDEDAARIQSRHGALFRELLPERRPLPGAIDLLRHLREEHIPHGIATSGRHPEIDASLTALGVPAGTVVIDRGDVLRAKPEPDLFLKCPEEIGVEIRRIAAPWARCSRSRSCTYSVAAMSRPRVGCDTTMSFGCSESSRPSTTFCWFPPERFPTMARGFGGRTSYSAARRPPARRIAAGSSAPCTA